MIKDDVLYLLSNKNLLVFDHDGNFLFKVGKRGNGPGEYLFISDVFINDDGVIDVFDGDQRRMIKYDQNGTYLTDFKVNYNISQIYRGDDDYYIFYAGNKPNDDISKSNRYNILIFEDERITNTYHPVTNERYRLRYVPRNTFSRFQDAILFQECLNDTIYRVTNNSFSPYYVIDFSENNFTKSKVEKGKSYSENKMELITKGVSELTYFKETDNFIVFTFQKGTKGYIYLYNKDSGNSKVLKGLVNDLEETGLSYPFLVTNDKLYFYYSAEAFIRRHSHNIGGSNLDENYKKVLSTTSDEDNPIIIEAHLKHF